MDYDFKKLNVTPNFYAVHSWESLLEEGQGVPPIFEYWDDVL